MSAGAIPDHSPFLTVDQAKAELGISYHTRLRPAGVQCSRCEQTARAAAGDHVCLWCRVSDLRGYPVFPTSGARIHTPPPA